MKSLEFPNVPRERLAACLGRHLGDARDEMAVVVVNPLKRTSSAHKGAARDKRAVAVNQIGPAHKFVVRVFTNFDDAQAIYKKSTGDIRAVQTGRGATREWPKILCEVTYDAQTVLFTMSHRNRGILEGLRKALAVHASE